MYHNGKSPTPNNIVPLKYDSHQELDVVDPPHIGHNFPGEILTQSNPRSGSPL